ncbi:hypothetical protein RUM44_009747 [Polyplax serrata]
MSDIDSENGSNQDDDICRDYMRNVCSRGRKCRFKHPNKSQPHFPGDVDSTKEERAKLVRMFCHDFQNTVCTREECKYIHSSKEDEDYFMETGSLPLYVLENAISKSVIPSLPSEAPVCKDYLSGECRRGKACRYRHLSLTKYRKELDFIFGVELQAAEHAQDTNNSEYSSENKRLKTSLSPCLPCNGDLTFLPMQCYFPHEKCKVHGNNYFYNTDRCSQSHFNGACQLAQESQLVLCGQNERSMSLQDENNFLKKRILDLKKQVSDLTATNEFLLEQNAQLRISRKNGNVGTVTPVSVTVTGTPVSVQPISQLPAPPAPGQIVTGTPVNVQLSGQTSTGQLVTMASQNASTQQLVAATVPVSIAPGSLAGGVNPSGQQIVSAPGQQIISTGTLSTVTVSGQTSAGQLVTAAVPVSCNATGQQIMAAVSTVTVAGQNGPGQQLVTATVPVSCTATGQQQLVPTAVSMSHTGQQLVPTGTTAGPQQLVPVSGTLTVGPSSAQQLVPVSLATAVPVTISAVSMAPVHIPPPIVTVAQPPNNPSNNLTMNGPPGQSLMSYPIMTQPVIQTNLQR